MTFDKMMTSVAEDYCNDKRDTSYRVYKIFDFTVDSDSYYTYKVIPSINTYSPTIETIDSLPDKYVIFDNKIFLWKTKKAKISKEMWTFMYENNIVDSIGIKYELNQISQEEFLSKSKFLIDETIAGTYYFICKNNGEIKKKTSTNEILERETLQAIKINCDN